jgi:hypothetical protein
MCFSSLFEVIRKSQPPTRDADARFCFDLGAAWGAITKRRVIAALSVCEAKQTR